jgi:hypothetical protein
MATIIDSLLVKLGLDSSEFDAKKSKVDKGLKDTAGHAEKTGAKLKKSGKDGAEGFENVAKSAAKFLALIGGTMAVKRFIENQIEANAALDRFAQNLNQGVNSISAWSNAAELAGGSAEGLQGTMDMLSKSQTELQLTGQSGLIPYFSALGVSLADTQGKARPVNELLLDLSDRFSKMDRTTANNMGRMMGIDQGTMQLLLKGRSEVELMIARQKEYGAVTKQQAEEASRLRNAMVAGRQSFEAFGRELLSAATPALEKMFAVFADFGAWIRENKEFVQTFLTIIAVGLAGIAAATIPINLTVVAVLALAAAVAALWQDYQTWKRGGDSFIDWSKWEPGFKAATAGIKRLKEMMVDIMYVAIAGADALIKFFSGDFEGAKIAGKAFWNGREQSPAPAAGGAAGADVPAPAAGGAAGADVPAPAAGGKGGQAAAMAYFQAQGWSKEQAAGLAANISRESNFRPDAVGDNGKAYGIGQWHPDRQAEFKKKFGKDIQGSSMEEQMAFMHYELTQGNERKAGNILRGTTGAAEAAAAVSSHYERPADKAGEAAKRGQLALSMLGGVPGASQAAAGAGAVQVAQANAAAAPGASSKSVETHIGEVKVYTAATDANGIAKDMGKSLDYLFTSQANYGLT